MSDDRSERGEDESADFDRRFSEIVAGFEPSRTNPPLHLPEPAPAHETTAPSEQGGASWRTWEGEDPGDHFVPAPTDPLPAGDIHFWAIVVGLAAGPLLVFLSAVLRILPGMPWGLLGVVMTVAGFVLLVLRSPRRRSGDDGTGARV